MSPEVAAGVGSGDEKGAVVAESPKKAFGRPQKEKYKDRLNLPVGLVIGNGSSVDLLSQDDWTRLLKLPHYGVNRCILSPILRRLFKLKNVLLIDHPRDVEHWGKTPGFVKAWKEYNGVRWGADRTGEADRFFATNPSWQAKKPEQKVDRKGRPIEIDTVVMGKDSAVSAANLLALENGCKTILLIGVDCMDGQLTVETEDYFDDELPKDAGEKKKEDRKKLVYRQRIWSEAVRQARDSGVALISICPKKTPLDEILERKQLDELAW